MGTKTHGTERHVPADQATSCVSAPQIKTLQDCFPNLPEPKESSLMILLKIHLYEILPWKDICAFLLLTSSSDDDDPQSIWEELMKTHD